MDWSLDANRRFLLNAARAAGGALLFSLPLLMTVEMWRLGFTMEPWRLAALLGVSLPVLVGLARFSGFNDPAGLLDEAVDACVAVAVGAGVSAALLTALAVIGGGPVSWPEAAGKVILQTVPAAMGAVFAVSQLGRPAEDGGGAGGPDEGGSDDDHSDDDLSDDDLSDESQSDAHRDAAAYGRELFLMVAGALFLAFSVAPTEEVVLLAHMVGPWRAMLIAAASVAVMHAFVYVVQFRGQHRAPEGVSAGSVFLRLTVVGYALCLLLSLFCLWAFGRADGVAWGELAVAVVVLSLPAAVGAAAARLIL